MIKQIVHVIDCNIKMFTPRKTGASFYHNVPQGYHNVPQGYH
jgi:hypothetical protein